jgi:hypothetical protein
MGYPVASFTQLEFRFVNTAGGRRIGWRIAVAVASVVALLLGPTIAASADDPALSNFTVTGTPYVNSPTINEQAVAGAESLSPAPSSYAYQWYLDGTALDGATSRFFTPTSDEQEHSLSVSVTAYLAGYNPVIEQSVGTPVLGQITTTGASLSGIYAVGQVVTALPGTWTPSDVTLTYYWKVTGGAAITSGTDATSITLTDAETRGVTLLIRGTRAGYANGTYAELDIPAFSPDQQLPGRVTISGSPVHNFVLTAMTDASSWDPSDLTEPYQYQWNRNGTPIPGATASTHLVIAADVGASITATITAGSSEFAPASATSQPVVPVENRPVMPVPTITGTAEVGEPVTATIVENDLTRQYGYGLVWFVNGVQQNRGWNGNWFYPLSEAQVGGVITVESEAFPPSGPIYSDPSTPTAPIKDGTIHPVGITVSYGNTLGIGQTVTPTLTNVADNFDTSYEIYRDGVPVSSWQYPLTIADWHHTIYVIATESVPGFAPVVTQSRSIVVGDGQFTGNYHGFDGAPHVGLPETIDISGLSPAPATESIRWYLGTGTIADKLVGRGLSYVPPVAYDEKYLWAEVVLTSPHTEEFVDFTTPERIQPGTLPAQSAPVISGRPFTGSPFTASSGTAAISSVTYHYQWYSAASAAAPLVAIAHATSRTYVPPASLRGRVLAVKVTASKTAYASESTVSARSATLLSQTALVTHPAPAHGSSAAPHTLL